jgi:DNA-binding transcriptional ArsR family regulator
MSLPAIMKHLDVLADAGLITRSKQGRTVTCRLNAAPMEEAVQWLERYERFWSERLDRLAAFVEKDQ